HTYTLFPYTTLFRSGAAIAKAEAPGTSSQSSVVDQNASSEEVPQGVQSGIKTVQRLENARTTKQLTEADFALRLDTEQSLLQSVDRKSTRLNSSHVK